MTKIESDPIDHNNNDNGKKRPYVLRPKIFKVQDSYISRSLVSKDMKSAYHIILAFVLFFMIVNAFHLYTDSDILINEINFVIASFEHVEIFLIQHISYMIIILTVHYPLTKLWIKLRSKFSNQPIFIDTIYTFVMVFIFAAIHFASISTLLKLNINTVMSVAIVTDCIRLSMKAYAFILESKNKQEAAQTKDKIGVPFIARKQLLFYLFAPTLVYRDEYPRLEKRDYKLLAKLFKRLEHLIMTPTILLVDIEGTTTSISFVHETLFPFVLQSLVEYLSANWNSAYLNADIGLLRDDALNEHRNGNLAIPLIPVSNNETKDEEIKQAIIRNIEYQMSIDRKSTSLKSIQGHIWQTGYQSGQLIGDVYPDVAAAFQRWTQELGIKIYIYSSGSIAAQKLLFRHTNEGDLLKYISGHFDTKIGAKVESTSYERILRELNTTSENVIFLTDILKEAQAAKSAGIESVILLRPGNYPIEKSELDKFRSISSFDELDAIYFK